MWNFNIKSVPTPHIPRFLRNIFYIGEDFFEFIVILSGIGLENTRRRLELMYPDSYTWQQTVEDGIYHIAISLRIKS